MTGLAWTQASAQDGGTIRITTRAQLDTALASARGGETLLLGNGDYGELVTGLDFVEVVTLRAENRLRAHFEFINLQDASGFAIEGVEVEAGIEIRRSSNISITKVDVTGTLYLRTASNVLIEDNRVHDGQYGISLNTVSNFVVRHNDVFGATEDLMRITGDSSGVVEGNVIRDPNNVSGHPDLIQIFGSNSPGTKYTPHDIIIRRNHLYALANGLDNGRYEGAQGIFMADPRTEGGFKNILIEENLIQVELTNALYVNAGTENVRILNNTLIPNAQDGSGLIRISDRYDYGNAGVTIEGNVAKLITDESGDATIGDNYIYGRGAPLTWIFSQTDGRQWRSFAPVPGTRIDFGSGYGAEAFVADLLAGRARLGPSWIRR